MFPIIKSILVLLSHAFDGVQMLNEYVGSVRENFMHNSGPLRGFNTKNNFNIASTT